MAEHVTVAAGKKSLAVIDLAQRGDPGALGRIRKALRDDPDVLKELGDLGRATRDLMLKSVRGEDEGVNVVAREAQREFLDQLQREIEGPAPTPLEQLLAQEVTICRLHLSLAQLRFAALERFTFAEADFHQRMMDRAQSRYLAAVKTLAQVRRLQLPSVQLNVAASGGRQINVAPTG